MMIAIGLPTFGTARGSGSYSPKFPKKCCLDGSVNGNKRKTMLKTDGMVKKQWGGEAFDYDNLIKNISST